MDDDAGPKRVKLREVGQRLAALSLAGLLAAPCIALAQRELERHQFERALAVNDANSLRAQPVLLSSVRERVAPYRRLQLRGDFDYSREVLVAGRPLHGEPGFHLVTPLRVEDGAFLVLRGWIPLAKGSAAGLATLRRSGEVVLEGFSLPPETPARQTVSDSAGSDSAAWPLQVEALRIDQLRARIEYPLFRYVVQQISGEDAALPEPLPGPRLGDVSHRRNANLLYGAAAVLAGLPFAGLWWLRRPS